MDNETRNRLIAWGQGDPASAYLAHAILELDGATEIDPVHPQGGPDGGKDILLKLNDVPCVAAVYFCANSNKVRFTALKTKFKLDATKAAKVGRPGFVFVTNVQLSDSERKTLDGISTVAGFSICAIYHLERIHPILDKPLGFGAREKYLGIRVSDAERISFFEARDAENRKHTKMVTDELQDMKKALAELLAHAMATGDKAPVSTQEKPSPPATADKATHGTVDKVLP